MLIICAANISQWNMRRRRLNSFVLLILLATIFGQILHASESFDSCTPTAGGDSSLAGAHTDDGGDGDGHQPLGSHGHCCNANCAALVTMSFTGNDRPDADEPNHPVIFYRSHALPPPGKPPAST